MFRVLEVPPIQMFNPVLPRNGFPSVVTSYLGDPGQPPGLRHLNVPRVHRSRTLPRMCARVRVRHVTRTVTRPVTHTFPGNHTTRTRTRPPSVDRPSRRPRPLPEDGVDPVGKESLLLEVGKGPLTQLSGTRREGRRTGPIRTKDSGLLRSGHTTLQGGRGVNTDQNKDEVRPPLGVEGLEGGVAGWWGETRSPPLRVTVLLFRLLGSGRVLSYSEPSSTLPPPTPTVPFTGPFPIPHY